MLLVALLEIVPNPYLSHRQLCAPYCSNLSYSKLRQQPDVISQEPPLVCSVTPIGFQFAAAREAVVRKARMRSASAPACIVGAVASPLELLMCSVCVRLPCSITRAA